MPNLRKATGFTLIEILVVLVIIGVAAGAATVAVGGAGPQKRINSLLDKFLMSSEYATDSAVIGGETVGLLLEPPQWRENPSEQGWLYSWQKLSGQGWVPMPELEPVEIPPEFEVIVMLEGREWLPEKPPEIKIPLIAFYPSGEVSPFEIELRHINGEAEPQHLLVNEWGEVEWQERAEDDEERQW